MIVFKEVLKHYFWFFFIIFLVIILILLLLFSTNIFVELKINTISNDSTTYTVESSSSFTSKSKINSYKIKILFTEDNNTYTKVINEGDYLIKATVNQINKKYIYENAQRWRITELLINIEGQNKKISGKINLKIKLKNLYFQEKKVSKEERKIIIEKIIEKVQNYTQNLIIEKPPSNKLKIDIRR
jgi:phosphoribosyl-ATP pyrophosphohydrolase